MFLFHTRVALSAAGGQTLSSSEFFIIGKFIKRNSLQKKVPCVNIGESIKKTFLLQTEKKTIVADNLKGGYKVLLNSQRCHG
ncbi:hypothetical protein TNCT_317031 [Trichonephila clavata]|uniref:Uncharacterized protein n=1 Tax=Trichonephila clavata TaxID=2740835 RepID=A0A8X6I616_TRICU|nr:hypothetical protein TNCT_317031 [Trichonephila clavata]